MNPPPREALERPVSYSDGRDEDIAPGAAGALTAPLVVAGVLRVRMSLKAERSKGFWRRLCRG